MHVIPPKMLSGFPGAWRVKAKTPFPGGLRARWKDGNGMIYEWDYQHGHVEMYDPRGNHRGAYSASSGQKVSEADSTRHVSP